MFGMLPTDPSQKATQLDINAWLLWKLLLKPFCACQATDAFFPDVLPE
jgi:hypothetical protein